jgi:hypothetical protein
MPDLTVFSDSFSEARERFVDAAKAAGARLTHYLHPDRRGPGGEALYFDVAVLGDPRARRVLVVGCGTHGIEGFSGSAAQTAWMRGPGASRIPEQTALVFFHAHNPWGFAHRQRVTENNVDLNRNFVDHGAAYPANPGYDEIHAAISPRHWDEDNIRRVFAALDAFRARKGEQAFSDAYNGGQYQHADGVFFGGGGEQWANRTFRRALREHVRHAERATIIDLHTGIGPYGEHVFLCFHPPGSAAYERARTWWGERAVNRQGSTHKALAHYHGLLLDAFQAELEGAETTAMVVEFGTKTRAEMQRASLSLRWLRCHGEQHPQLAARVHADYVEAFYPSDPAWRSAVLAQSQVFIDQALAGIARES